MSELAFVRDIGYRAIATIKEAGTILSAIASATTKSMSIRGPDGSTVSGAATFVSGGVDGKLQYTTVSGDLSAAGTWYYQPLFTGLSGWDGGTEILTFEVGERLK